MYRFAFAISMCLACSHPHEHNHPPNSPEPHHGAMNHRFEHADEWAPVFDDPKRDDWQKPDAVVAALEINPGMTVADIGAGTGYFEHRLSTAVGEGGKVLAVDIEPDMVRYLDERAKREGTPNVTAVLAQPGEPQLAPASVDRILIVDTWHHIPDRVAYAKKLAAALKPGGFVLVVDFTLESEKGPPRAHRLAPDAVRGELASANMTASVVDAGLTDQYIVKAGVR